MTSETLKPLTRKRGTVKAKLTIFNNNLKSIKDTLNKQTPPRILDEVKVAELQQRIEVSSNIIYEFNETQDKIEATVEEKHLEEQYNERADFEQLFYESIAAARVFLSSHTKREENHTTLTPINDNNQNQRVNTFDIRLPRIELPDFSGSFEQWVPFRDTFNSIIHENSSLPDIQKLHYLNAALTGEAKQIIQSLEISANNYAVAWKLLKDRYENERLIVRGHVKALFELPLITKETSHKLRQLCDGTMKHIRALNALASPEDAANSILIHLLTMKLDHNTQREWEASNNSSKLPTVDELTEFLSQKCQILEALEGNKTQANNSQPKASYRVNAHTATVAQQPCPQCQGEHFIFKCPTFFKKTTADRVNTSKQLKLCLNCLRPNHFSRDCKSTSTCRTCSKRHNSLLHHNEEETKSKNTPPTKSCVANSPGQVLLSTAMVIVRDSDGREFDCRALLDSGSQAHFMTKGLSDKLKTKTHKINYPITGIGQKLTSIKEKAEITIKSKYNGFKVKLNCLIIPQIIETTPSVEFEKAALNIPSNLKLADPQFHQPRPVDILIGADLFYSLLCIGQFKTAPKQVILQKTKLGCIASGSINSLNQYDLNSMCCAGNKQEPTLEDKIERFWKQEEAEVKKHLSKEEMQCEEHYISTVARDKDGRYQVRLPKRQNKQVGDSYETAKKRLLALERRLEADEQTRAEYHKFLVEYEALGHMTIYNETNEENMSYYLPHHAVYKASSSTTRVRVVFDGSAKSSNGVSLNDILMVGPTIQDDLFSILIRFRTYTFVITADIEKMYRQVNVNSEDRSLQKILWRRHSSEPVKTYVLNTVTYGTSCASFLAIRTLKKLAEDEASTLPEVAKIINSDFYVDYLITGASTIEKACELQKNITNVLAKGQFPLRKWRSNHPMIQSQTTDILNLDKEDIQKTLGLNWNSTTDEFLYNVEISELPRITKRSILSTIAKIHDPLGLIGPVLIIAKLIMQQLWQLNINWDESIPIELHTKWNEIYKGLQDLNALKIPRYINPNNNIACEMHGFADASESAYGACIYIRYPNNEKTTVKLLCSKARVAPLKSVSLPRLELCGAVLLAQLINKLTRIIHLKIDRIYCWTDSTITLHWINMQPNTLKTYVANRVAEIQTLIPEAKWKHILSNSNPADVISRGSTPTTLLKCKLWWAGPEWLIYDEQQWPRLYTITTENVEFNSEVKVSPEISLVSAVQDNNVSQVMQKYASFLKLQRVVAYCLRFTQNATPKAEKSTKEYLTLGELQRATTKILQFVQKTYFQKELNDLEQNRLVNKQSKLVSLNPFLDKDGLIRVGGRLSNSQLSTNHKHPVVLPSDHHVTRIIMRNEHISRFHCGAQALVSYIRLKYWPLSCKNLAKGITRNCVTCYKYKPKPIEHIMGNLPEGRITSTIRPFQICGVDYCGPFLIRESKGRGRIKTTKGYLSIFVCFTTKSIHIEVVTDLTAESYLAAFRRFTARRGLPSDVYSDNGTNFVKANRELNEIFNSLNQNQDLIIKELIKCNVKWHFIPSRSPHFGGLWEAAVKSVKQHLTKILKNILLTYEEFITLVIQIEACVNSRPLTALSDDPNDLNVLTPSHFLIGDSLFAPCEYVYEHVKDNLLTRWQHLLKMRQHFWRRWSTEYLHQMQQRTKWTSGNEGLKMGSLVILMDDNLPPQRWPVGRIVELFPGKDNIVRVVSVKTVSGVYKRAVKKVCLLPVNV